MKTTKFTKLVHLRMSLPLPWKFFLRNIKTILNPQHLISLLSFYGSDKVQNFFNMLKPYECGYPLIRVGFNGDGGYLIPESSIEWEGVVSPGVGGSIEFEKSLASTQTQVILIDGSVESPKNLPLNFHFYKKMLAINSMNNSEITLGQVMDKHNLRGKRNLLQMDIEGFEWEVIPHISYSDLLEFEVVIVEFHFLDSLSDTHTYFDKEIVIKQLHDSFFVCHFHINNEGGFFYSWGKRYPKVVEVTWLRRDKFTQGKLAHIPHTLDYPNDTQIYDWNKFGSRI